MDFESILEFSGRPHIDHIFKFADRDNDGYISVPDFVAAMEDLGRLYSDEEKIRGKTPSRPSSSQATELPVSLSGRTYIISRNHVAMYWQQTRANF